MQILAYVHIRMPKINLDKAFQNPDEYVILSVAVLQEEILGRPPLRRAC